MRVRAAPGACVGVRVQRRACLSTAKNPPGSASCLAKNLQSSPALAVKMGRQEPEKNMAFTQTPSALPSAQRMPPPTDATGYRDSVGGIMVRPSSRAQHDAFSLPSAPL